MFSRTARAVGRTLRRHRYVQSELAPAELCLMHRPGSELVTASLHPCGALFETSVNFAEAEAAHSRFRQLLQDHDVTVVALQDALTSLPRQKLVHAASSALQYKFDGDISMLTPEDLHLMSDNYKHVVLQSKTKKELVDILISAPTVVLDHCNMNNPLMTKEVVLRPLGNLVFTRDQQIITNKGIVICRLRSQQRIRETELLALAWEALRYPIVGDLAKAAGPSSDMFVEGGDFFPIGDEICYIGVGLRTTMPAVQYMMDHDLLGTKKVVVVEDIHDCSQERMHLDTVFNIVDRKRVIALATILGKDNPMKRVCKVFERQEDGSYLLATQDVEFAEWLTEHEGYTIIPVDDQEQAEYMLNFVNLGPVPAHPDGVIVAVHPGLKERLVTYGYEGDIHFLDYRGVTKMYGAAHCSTQILRSVNWLHRMDHMVQ